jgi:hypothetical protein
LSFPAGLPLFPASKGIWGVASVLHFQLLARIPGPVPLHRTTFFIAEQKRNIKERPLATPLLQVFKTVV